MKKLKEFSEIDPSLHFPKWLEAKNRVQLNTMIEGIFDNDLKQKRLRRLFSEGASSELWSHELFIQNNSIKRDQFVINLVSTIIGKHSESYDELLFNLSVKSKKIILDLKLKTKTLLEALGHFAPDADEFENSPIENDFVNRVFDYHVDSNLVNELQTLYVTCEVALKSKKVWKKLAFKKKKDGYTINEDGLKREFQQLEIDQNHIISLLIDVDSSVFIAIIDKLYQEYFESKGKTKVIQRIVYFYTGYQMEEQAIRTSLHRYRSK